MNKTTLAVILILILTIPIALASVEIIEDHEIDWGKRTVNGQPIIPAPITDNNFEFEVKETAGGRISGTFNVYTKEGLTHSEDHQFQSFEKYTFHYPLDLIQPDTYYLFVINGNNFLGYEKPVTSTGITPEKITYPSDTIDERIKHQISFDGGVISTTIKKIFTGITDVWTRIWEAEEPIPDFRVPPTPRRGPLPRFPVPDKERPTPGFIGPLPEAPTPILEEPEGFGYIIQFKEEPVVVKEFQLKEKGFSPTEIKDISKKHRQKIEATQQKTIADIENILGRKDLRIKKIQNVLNAIAIDIPYEIAEEIKEWPDVKAVCEDSKVYGALGQSVPLINADDVWNLADTYGKNITGQNITIAWIDSGIDYTHPDFGSCTTATFLAGNCNKVIGGFDFVNNDTDPIDDHGHGTHTSSTAAGNGTIKGVAPDAKLLAYKVLNQWNWGSWSDTIAGIDRSVDPNQDNDISDRADVVCAIVGGRGNDPDHISSQALDNAALTGAIAVVAAGNTGHYGYKTMNMPGTSRKAITVGGSDKSDGLYYYSSRGETSVGAIKPDVVAPGVSICAARHANAWPSRLCVDNQHVAISGTSMATPHVAGLAALLKQKYPNWTTAETKMALRNTAVDIGYDHRTQGWGRVDALAAILLNVTPCIAEFNTYNFIGAFRGSVNINGTATCLNNFLNYTIYYGQGKEPTSWTLIHSSNTPVSDGILTGWNTSFIQDAVYTLKLLVSDNNNRVSEDRLIFNTINNQSHCFSCEDCDAKVNFAGASVTLANNINSNSNCISIGADNVTLDCAGHRLTGGGYYNGIFVDHSNVKIKNCRVTNFTDGIYLSGSVNSNLTNNNMYNNRRFNFYNWAYNFSQGNHSIDTSNKVGNKTLHYYYNQHNQVIENLDSGHLELIFCSNMTVRNNAVNNGDGIRLHWTDDSVVANNILTGNTYSIEIDGFNHNNKIVNNIASNTSYAHAFLFYVSYNNNIINNTVSNNLGNQQSGIIMWSSDYNTLANNTISNNDGQGIVIFKSHNNNLINNYVFNNTLIQSWSGGGGIKIESANNNSLLNNTILSNSAGIFLSGDATNGYSSNNTILYNEISNNTQGIKFWSTDTVGVSNNISYNNIYNNTWNLNNAQVNNVTAENNWWGTTLCPNVDLKIWDYYDYSGNGIVDYNPILNSGWPSGSPANCTIPPPACGQTLTRDTNLSQSLTSNGTCFTLGANNIVLDCKGYSLTGNGSGYGVVAYAKNGLTIKNCKIYNFSEGVYLEGIYYSHAQQSILDNNTLNNNSKYGIRLQYYDNNNLINNRAMNNSKGIRLQNSDYNNLTNNRAMNNSNVGIELSLSDNNNLINNSALNNIQAGFMLFVSDNNKLINNSATNNVWAGFRIERSSNNDLINNIANSDYQGILFYGSVSDPSSNNVLLYNNISNNVEGIRFGSTDFVGSGNNISYNNIFNNTNYDFYNSQRGNVTAENNWWGTYICQNVRVWDYYDDNTKGIVDYDPILSSSWPGGNVVICGGIRRILRNTTLMTGVVQINMSTNLST
ncbi:MAG: S8 family serine peptidase [Nanoarchaeota archaeon]|nr:S8 family serine peptidase [Nanoarchaeota archaeon]